MLKEAFRLVQTMGLRYVAERAKHELERRTGILKKRFPVNPPFQEFSSLEVWKELPLSYPALPADAPPYDQRPDALHERVTALKEGYVTFFGGKRYRVVDWLTNPLTGYRYDINRHWTQIPDFSANAGDIKYVWEKSRFTFLYDLIRYETHFQEDQAEYVFGEIESWIVANPVNQGPNWRCSQEISLRVMHWTFALHHYKNAPTLTPARFARIVHSVFWQMKHVAAHSHFSRRLVRNNHALTETLALYLAGLFYPFFTESAQWKKDGKQWFEQEIAYQIYDDGTFLQFSMNYHRVAVQLLTLALTLAHRHGECWAEVVYDRARRSLDFLRTCQDAATGWLPNYGSNDGALFFPLSESHFRDYRPQLRALADALHSVELPTSVVPTPLSPVAEGTHAFERGGYYVLRERAMLTFLRCGSYKDRPFQADMLHLDLWVDGENILRDAGSYLYNTEERWTRYFSGTASHNTVMLGDYDQMRKGPRFVWYDWIAESSAGWLPPSEGQTVFEGSFTGFRQAGKNSVHRRRVTTFAGEPRWLVEDWLDNAPDQLPMHQMWHPSEHFFEKFTLKTFDFESREIAPSHTPGWYSETYGQKVSVPRLVFSTPARYLRTCIEPRKITPQS